MFFLFQASWWRNTGSRVSEHHRSGKASGLVQEATVDGGLKFCNHLRFAFVFPLYGMYTFVDFAHPRWCRNVFIQHNSSN